MLSKAHLTSHSRMSGSNTVLNQLAWTTRDKLAAPNFAFIGLLQWRALHNRGNVKQRRKKSTIMIGFGCKKSEVTQLCLTLCDSMDCSLPGSSVHGILQARTLGCHALLQGIFPTQGWNWHLWGLLHWQVLPLASPGKPLNDYMVISNSLYLNLCLNSWYALHGLIRSDQRSDIVGGWVMDHYPVTGCLLSKF